MAALARRDRESQDLIGLSLVTLDFFADLEALRFLCGVDFFADFEALRCF
jgi:hypothetical protein